MVRRRGGERQLSEEGPERRCLVTGEVKPKTTLVRFVVGPDGTVVPDVASRLPGRGLWVTAERDIMALAVTRRLFARAARAQVTAPPDLVDRVERLLAERCREHIGLARRAGQAVAGYEKVREAVKGGRAGLLVEAADGAAGGREKIVAAGAGLPVVDTLRSDELGLAFGRDHVVHAAVSRGGFAERLQADAGRLAGFRRARQNEVEGTG